MALTSTLASTQLSYAPITITAGEAKLTAVPTGTTDPGGGGSSMSSEGAGGVEATAAVRWMVVGVGVGVVALLGAL